MPYQTVINGILYMYPGFFHQILGFSNIYKASGDKIRTRQQVS